MNPNWKIWFEDQPYRGGARTLPLVQITSGFASELCLLKDIDPDTSGWTHTLMIKLLNGSGLAGLTHDIVLDAKACTDWDAACEEAEKRAAEYLGEMASIIQATIAEIKG